MTGNVLDFDTSLADFPKDEWVQAVAELCEQDGHFQRLGDRHFAAYAARSETLLVTFETIQGIQVLSDMAQPLGWEMVRGHDWSHLCIASDGDTWFRDPAIYAYFDQMVDDGFFDEFDTVLFYGAGPCGYAAAAFSVVAPGAHVLAIQPQATLDPRVCEWDDRFVDMRRTDFTSRYGYAPDMLDAAETAYVLYDPSQQLDAMHAALFTRQNVGKHRLRYMGDAIQTDLLKLNMLLPLIEAAAQGSLNDAFFASHWRARRSYPPYLRSLMAVAEKRESQVLLTALCRNVTSRMQAPRFARRLSQLNPSR